jgi:hypothetical protein
MTNKSNTTLCLARKSTATAPESALCHARRILDVYRGRVLSPRRAAVASLLISAIARLESSGSLGEACR